MEGMKEHQVFVLVGETGSGKTTQVKIVPQAIHTRIISSCTCRLCVTIIQIYYLFVLSLAKLINEINKMRLWLARYC